MFLHLQFPLPLHTNHAPRTPFPLQPLHQALVVNQLAVLHSLEEGLAVGGEVDDLHFPLFLVLIMLVVVVVLLRGNVRGGGVVGGRKGRREKLPFL